jgi:sigma-B regulation protein RsbU (phosphoserine phosphatase)
MCYLLNNTDGPQFVTAQYLLLDFDVRLVRYAIAGHHASLHFTQNNGGFVPLIVEQAIDGPPLGIIQDFIYGTHVTSFANGDIFLLYTDGLFEVFSPEGDEFGQERLLAALQERCLLAVPTIFKEIVEELEKFTGKNTFPDDICLIGLEVSMLTEMNMPEQVCRHSFS